MVTILTHTPTQPQSFIIEEFLGRPLRYHEDPWQAVSEAMEATDDTRPFQVVREGGNYYVYLASWSEGFSDEPELSSNGEDEDWDQWREDGFPESLPDLNSLIPQVAGIVDGCGGYRAA